MKWMNVKDKLPPNDTEVQVKVLILWPTKIDGLYIDKYFIVKEENITKWVTHWKT
jgi:hypothetical protein